MSPKSNREAWQNIVVFGKKGMGKTSWIYHFIKDNPQDIYFIYDHFHEYKFEASSEYNSITDFWDKNFTSKINIFRGEIDYDDFFRLCLTIGNCVCVFDEIDMVCSPAFISDPLYRIIHYGRHVLNEDNEKVFVKLIGASRRPANVSRDLTSQADSVIVFKIDEPRDIKYLNEYTSVKVALLANKLDRLEFLVYP